MTIEIYGRPGCGQCEQAKLKLFREGKVNQTPEKFAYDYLMIDDHQEELEQKFNTKFRTLPVIVHEGQLYNFNTLGELIAKIKSS